MNDIQVPDPGLINKVEALILASPEDESFMDVEIQCKDGKFCWSRLLLSSISSMLESALADDKFTDHIIILPDVNKDHFQSLLSLFLTNSWDRTVDSNSLKILKLLGIDYEKMLVAQPQSIVKITSSPVVKTSTPVKKEQKCLENDNDVDILFFREEEIETPSKKSKRKMHCKFCSLNFASQQYAKYQEHINSHKNSEGYFECPFENCGKVFKVWCHLSDHFYSHTNDPKPHMCSYCDYTSITRANVKKHELAVHVDPERRDFECIVCAKKFKTSSNLIEHSKIHDNESFKCSDCLKTFKSKRGLEHHRRTHTGELFSCQVCGEQFLSKNSVNRHHRDIHGYLTTNEEKNKCTKKGCLAEFSSQEDYRLHVRTAHHSKASVLICHLCQKICSTKMSLKLHFKKVHSNEQLVIENRKASSIHGGKNVSLLKQDRSRLSDTSSKLDASLSVSQNLNSGVNNSSKYTCNCCNKKFRFKFQLLRHVGQRTRGGNFCCVEDCDLAEAEFETPELLELHLQQHTGETSFYCDICYKSYGTELARDRHVATHETGKHTCPYCHVNQPNRMVLNMHTKYCQSKTDEIVIFVENE